MSAFVLSYVPMLAAHLPGSLSGRVSLAGLRGVCAPALLLPFAPRGHCQRLGSGAESHFERVRLSCGRM